MKKNPIILQASSNSAGDTHLLASYISLKAGIPIIDLKKKNIGQFDYQFANRNDDFLPLMREIVDMHDLVIFATPVYWYTMSGIMKKFLDRISDCLKIEKETGRKLRGKKMAVLSCSSDNELKEGFHMPFIESASYLGMTYLGAVHGWVNAGEIPDPVQQNLDEFIELIKL